MNPSNLWVRGRRHGSNAQTRHLLLKISTRRMTKIWLSTFPQTLRNQRIPRIRAFPFRLIRKIRKLTLKASSSGERAAHNAAGIGAQRVEGMKGDVAFLPSDCQRLGLKPREHLAQPFNLLQSVQFLHLFLLARQSGSLPAASRMHVVVRLRNR